MSEEETPLEPDGQEGSPEGPTGDAEATLEDAAEAAANIDSTADQVESQQLEEFDWSKYQNADRFKGRGLQWLIDNYNSLAYNYGTQARELGDLRRFRSETESRHKQTPDRSKENTQRRFTDGQKYEFAQKWQDEPLNAVSEFMVPQLAEQLRPLLLEQVKQELGPTLQTQAQRVATQTEYDALVRDYPEIETDQELRWMTEQILGPNYLGDRAPFKEAMFLAKLGRDEPSLFGATCELMRGGIPYEKARKYAELEQSAPASAETKKKQLKEEIKGVRRGVKSSTKNARTTEPEISDMDDVAEYVKDKFS